MQTDPAVMAFLLSRRSRPAKMLDPPVPTEPDLRPLITAAARVPDHGKLEPWRFIVLARTACVALAGEVGARAVALGLDDAAQQKASEPFAKAHLIVTVVASPKSSEKIPAIEQTLSAGAVCLGLVNAALASGWGANWLSGWPAHDRAVQEFLGLDAHELVAGFIHLGTARATPPERPRPDITALTEWRR